MRRHRKKRPSGEEVDRDHQMSDAKLASPSSLPIISMSSSNIRRGRHFPSLATKPTLFQFEPNGERGDDLMKRIQRKNKQKLTTDQFRKKELNGERGDDLMKRLQKKNKRKSLSDQFHKLPSLLKHRGMSPAFPSSPVLVRSRRRSLDPRRRRRHSPTRRHDYRGSRKSPTRSDELKNETDFGTRLRRPTRGIPKEEKLRTFLQDRLDDKSGKPCKKVSRTVSYYDETSIINNTPILTESRFLLATEILGRFEKFFQQDYSPLLISFSYLEARDMQSMSFVCKQFYALTSSNFVWKCFCLQQKNPLFTFCNRIDKYLYYKRLFYQMPDFFDADSIRCVSNSMKQKKIKKEEKRLKMMKKSDSSGTISDSDIRELYSRISDEESITFSTGSIRHSLRRNLQLQQKHEKGQKEQQNPHRSKKRLRELKNRQKVKLFSLFDRDNDSVLSLRDFKRTNNQFGWKLREDEMSSLLERFKNYERIGGLRHGDIQEFIVLLHDIVLDNVSRKVIRPISKKQLRAQLRFPNF